MAIMCRGGNQANTKPIPDGVKPPAKTHQNFLAAAQNALVVTTDPPWHCHKCYAVVADQKLTKCPQDGCREKRLAVDKPPADPKVLIGKEALKIIKQDETGGTEAGAEEKKMKEIARLKQTIADAKAYDWPGLLANAEAQLEKLAPKAKSPDIDTAKDTRTVMSDRVRWLHEHEAKVAALETKKEEATAAIARHEAGLEKAIKLEKERHAECILAAQTDFARMIRVEKETIEKATQALELQQAQFAQADDQINSFIAKRLPVDPTQAAITPDMLNTTLITNHLMQDEKIKGILDLQAAGVAESLCSLLNLIVDSRNQPVEESGSEMEDDSELIDATVADADGYSLVRGRRRRVKGPTGTDQVMTENAKNEAGKRTAAEVTKDKEVETPPPKVPTPPKPTDDGKAKGSGGSNDGKPEEPKKK